MPDEITTKVGDECIALDKVYVACPTEDKGCVCTGCAAFEPSHDEVLCNALWACTGWYPNSSKPWNVIWKLKTEKDNA